MLLESTGEREAEKEKEISSGQKDQKEVSRPGKEGADYVTMHGWCRLQMTISLRGSPKERAPEED